MCSTALEGVDEGDRVVILTWLDRADREVLAVPPARRPVQAGAGVFATRSQHRPRPIRLHQVEVVSFKDGQDEGEEPRGARRHTVIDVKPVLSAEISER